MNSIEPGEPLQIALGVNEDPPDIQSSTGGPDMADLSRRRTGRSRRRRTTGVMSLIVIASLGAGVVLSTQGQESTVVNAAPADATTLTPPDGETDLDDPDCPAGTPADRRTREDAEGRKIYPEETRASFPQVDDAAEEVEALGASVKHGKYYVGVKACDQTGVVTVYRVVGSADFDDHVKAITQRHEVQAKIKDAPLSVTELDAVEASVQGRQSELLHDQIELYSVDRRMEGFVLVEVSQSISRAREILADLGSKIQIVIGSPAEPLVNDFSKGRNL